MKTFSIAGKTIENRYLLAPLAGFSDYAMRALSMEHGASMVYTEMESSEALFYNSKETIEDLKQTHLDKVNFSQACLALQLFGGKKDIVLASIPIAESLAEYDFLDFNCGCPVNKVVKQHAGSYWLKREDELIELLKEMVKLSKKPVIVKIRIGFNDYRNAISLAKRIESTGVQALCVHGRTRDEFFQNGVHYDVIKAIKDNLTIPVIANGGINQENITSVMQKTDCDAYMIGQAAIGYPKIFTDLLRIEEGQAVEKTTILSQIRDLREHLDLIYSIKDERTASAIMRAISVKYFRSFPSIKKYRNLLVHCSTKAEYLKQVQIIEDEYEDNRV